MQFTVTPLADAGVAVLPPDVVWLKVDGTPAGLGEPGIVGDFALSTSADQGGVGGLVARDPLRTAVILLLFTDARAETWQLRAEHAGDPRGWAGDGFDVDVAGGEAPLGSRLWLFRRRELTDGTAMEVQAEAERALKPLLKQGAAARIDVTAAADKANGRIVLGIDIYGRDGRTSYAAKFDILWKGRDGL